MSGLTPLPFGLPGQIYRSPMPFGAFDPGRSLLRAYHRAEIDTVVMLTAPGEDLERAGRDLKDVYTQEGMQVIHFPIVDFDVPADSRAMSHAIDQVIALAQEGSNVAVHCFAGQGRTGMFVALLARRILNLGGPEAIAWTRNHFPAIETEEQAQVVLRDSG